MTKLRLLPLILSLGASPLACNKASDQDSDLSWGHLQDQSLNPKTPQYLINKGPNDIYKVCVAQYMVDDLPGVEEEIKAAINIWAAYLGRSIQVETIVKDQPRATASDRSDTLQTAYYKNCGDDVDVVMGFSPFSGGTVGQTGSSWRGFSSTNITSFKRHLFLRDYAITPDSWGTTRWVSQQELNSQPFVSQDLLNTMQARHTVEVAPRGTAVALQVLVHEFGHVWGLCDQYEGPSNCDPNFKSEHPELNSIMASASNMSKIFLTDDDIAGIRALATRPGFNDKWPGTEDELAQAATPLALNEVTYFKLKSVQKTGTQFTLNFGVVTAKKGGELRFEYRLKGTETWQTSSTYFPSSQAFMIPDYSFKQTVRTDGDYEFRLNLRLKGDDGALAAPVYATLPTN
ncbi:MAG TPA: hypothetical protein VE954_33825 [Oligoflexus sp.]|uniref:hypothetical protein n=1 Tax=Oligoflexus sp. TaxID=1971216 RepID=UPI002D32EBC2|nr:hypothetical protein [Oligoflexus sp.]HYX38106.1 hypothetical protein [Oligoflexus sp.]